jgi:photosystem II stability/assembly factor-like uncharacterized protein
MKAPAFLIAAGMLGLAVAAPTWQGPAPAFRDVLDTPAVKSPLAAQGMLLGLAQAGKRLVAVGQRGHVVLSDDNGKTWQQADVPVSSDLVAVHFPTAQRGWAVGHDGVVLHTADGGRSWTRQRDGRPNAADVPLLDVWFADERTGYAVGAFGLLLRTEDGGARWDNVSANADNPKSLHLYSVRGIGGKLFAAGEQGLLLKFDNAAGRWRAVELPYKGTLFGVTGNGRVLVAHGLRGNAVRSTDGGATWQAVSTGVPVGLTANAVDAEGRILLASQAGHLVASSDDGASFAPVKLQRPVPATAMLAAGTRTLLVAGPRGVRTIDLP